MLLKWKNMHSQTLHTELKNFALQAQPESDRISGQVRASVVCFAVTSFDIQRMFNKQNLRVSPIAQHMYFMPVRIGC